MKQELVQFITDYLNYFVILELDTPQLREKIRTDFNRLPGVQQVVFCEDEPMKFIKILTDSGDEAVWNFARNVT